MERIQRASHHQGAVVKLDLTSLRRKSQLLSSSSTSGAQLPARVLIANNTRLPSSPPRSSMPAHTLTIAPLTPSLLSQPSRQSSTSQPSCTLPPAPAHVGSSSPAPCEQHCQQYLSWHWDGYQWRDWDARAGAVSPLRAGLPWRGSLLVSCTVVSVLVERA